MENLSQLIHRLGINATYRGYHYLYRAVLLALSDEDYLLSITKKMYLDIAAYYVFLYSKNHRKQIPF